MNGDQKTARFIVATDVLAMLDDPKEKERVYYAECSYRRGFTQGVNAALDAIEKGKNMQEMEAWLERLMEWRAQVGKGGDYCPEQL